MILEESMMIATTSVDGTTRDTTKTAEPPPSISTTSLKQPQPGYVLAQSYRPLCTDKNYVTVGPQCSERELYSTMVQAAVDLNKAYRGVKGMISKVKIYVNKDGQELADASYEMHKGRRVLTLNALFDGGADGGGFDETIIDLVDSLESKRLTVGTAIGANTKEYSRAKLKLIGNRFQEEIIHNMSAI
jgi:hypothetical protein